MPSVRSADRPPRCSQAYASGRSRTRSTPCEPSAASGTCTVPAPARAVAAIRSHTSARGTSSREHLHAPGAQRRERADLGSRADQGDGASWQRQPVRVLGDPADRRRERRLHRPGLDPAVELLGQRSAGELAAAVGNAKLGDGPPRAPDRPGAQLVCGSHLGERHVEHRLVLAVGEGEPRAHRRQSRARDRGSAPAVRDRGGGELADERGVSLAPVLTGEDPLGQIGVGRAGRVREDRPPGGARGAAPVDGRERDALARSCVGWGANAGRRDPNLGVGPHFFGRYLSVGYISYPMASNHRRCFLCHRHRFVARAGGDRRHPGRAAGHRHGDRQDDPARGTRIFEAAAGSIRERHPQRRRTRAEPVHRRG